jgi:hypothetical protein
MTFGMALHLKLHFAWHFAWHFCMAFFMAFLHGIHINRIKAMQSFIEKRNVRMTCKTAQSDQT